jgi:hypothetical protein
MNRHGSAVNGARHGDITVQSLRSLEGIHGAMNSGSSSSSGGDGVEHPDLRHIVAKSFKSVTDVSGQEKVQINGPSQSPSEDGFKDTLRRKREHEQLQVLYTNRDDYESKRLESIESDNSVSSDKSIGSGGGKSWSSVLQYSPQQRGISRNTYMANVVAQTLNQQSEDGDQRSAIPDNGRESSSWKNDRGDSDDSHQYQTLGGASSGDDSVDRASQVVETMRNDYLNILYGRLGGGGGKDVPVSVEAIQQAENELTKMVQEAPLDKLIFGIDRIDDPQYFAPIVHLEFIRRLIHVAANMDDYRKKMLGGPNDWGLDEDMIVLARQLIAYWGLSQDFVEPLGVLIISSGLANEANREWLKNSLQMFDSQVMREFTNVLSQLGGENLEENVNQLLNSLIAGVVLEPIGNGNNAGGTKLVNALGNGPKGKENFSDGSGHLSSGPLGSHPPDGSRPVHQDSSQDPSQIIVQEFQKILSDSSTNIMKKVETGEVPKKAELSLLDRSRVGIAFNPVLYPFARDLKTLQAIFRLKHLGAYGLPSGLLGLPTASKGPFGLLSQKVLKRSESVAKKQSIETIYERILELYKLEKPDEVSGEVTTNFVRHRKAVLDSISQAINLGMTGVEIAEGVGAIVNDISDDMKKYVIFRINSLLKRVDPSYQYVGNKYTERDLFGDILESIENIKELEISYRQLNQSYLQPNLAQTMWLSSLLFPLGQSLVSQEALQSQKDSVAQELAQAKRILEESIGRVKKEHIQLSDIRDNLSESYWSILSRFLPKPTRVLGSNPMLGSSTWRPPARQQQTITQGSFWNFLTRMTPWSKK